MARAMAAAGVAKEVAAPETKRKMVERNPFEWLKVWFVQIVLASPREETDVFQTMPRSDDGNIQESAVFSVAPVFQ